MRLLDAAHALGVPLAFVPSFRRSAIDGRSRSGAPPGTGLGGGRGRGPRTAAGQRERAGPDEATALVERVGSPAFRLLLDTYNPRVAGWTRSGWWRRWTGSSRTRSM
ncbi:hypothetical protein NKH77_38845 [Streptomyces sp. M19]